MSRKKPSIPGTVRHDLRGMDGGPRLRAALDAIPKRESYDMVVVDNSFRGPNIIDTRGMKGQWVIEGLIPGGVITAVADLDDPPPKTLLDNGFDVVHLLETRGEPVIGERVGFRVYFHERLGLEPAEPFEIAFNGATWDKV